MVLATVCAIFGLYLFVIIWARKADVLDERKVRLTFLSRRLNVSNLKRSGTGSKAI